MSPTVQGILVLLALVLAPGSSFLLAYWVFKKLCGLRRWRWDREEKKDALRSK